MSKTIFTLAEAAELLSCHKETLRRAIKDGVLRAARLGREYRISRPDLESFWAARGGGELFEKNAPESDAGTQENIRPEVKETRPPKPSGPQQLTLLENLPGKQPAR